MSDLKYWELSMGGETGSVCMDASISTAPVTGLQAGLIDVHADTVFDTLSVVSVLTSTPVNFKVTNALTGVTRSAGLLWPGYNRWFTAITLTSGQISYYQKRND